MVHHPEVSQTESEPEQRWGAYDGPIMNMIDFFNLDNGTDYHY